MAKTKFKPKAIPDQTTPKEESPSSSGVKKRGQVDPEILELRRQHRMEMKKYLLTRDSESILNRVIAKEIPRMIIKHQEKLRDHLDRITTPPLPGTEEDSGPTDPEPTLTEAQAQNSPWPAEPPAEMAEI